MHLASHPPPPPTHPQTTSHPALYICPQCPNRNRLFTVAEFTQTSTDREQPGILIWMQNNSTSVFAGETRVCQTADSEKVTVEKPSRQNAFQSHSPRCKQNENSMKSRQDYGFISFLRPSWLLDGGYEVRTGLQITESNGNLQGAFVWRDAEPR